ncbi:hypothetical protein FA13DRAFT_199762 [Coprinellus micaceus]|uniref:Uncharacterized protein n=1 Tax=Coprinellus micaceus TaxID=71717 RepID=A0A4Y7SG16_COPMI|nr:hypothetical protein FA13DRAFT_199762 [Coprinellus micaceus]
MPPTTFAGNLISTAHGPGSLHGSPQLVAQSPPSLPTYGSPPSHSSLGQSPMGYGSPPNPSLYGSPPSSSIRQSPTPAQRGVVPGAQKSPTNLAFPSQKSPTALAFPSQKSPTSPSFSVGSGSGSFGAASGSRFRNTSNRLAPRLRASHRTSRERAPSIATNGTVNSNGTWEGAFGYIR